MDDVTELAERVLDPADGPATTSVGRVLAQAVLGLSAEVERLREQAETDAIVRQPMNGDPVGLPEWWLRGAGSLAK